MQTSLVAGLSQRLTYYAGRLYVGQISEVKSYRDLCPAISICVLTRSMFPLMPQFHLDFRLREQSDQVLTNDLQIHLVELAKSRAEIHNISQVSPLERWAFLFLNAHRMDTDELRRLLPEPEFHEALGVLEMIARTPATRELYDARLKAQLDEEARLEYARTEARAEARAEGEQIGQIRGEQIGQIRLMQRLLRVPQTSSDELADSLWMKLAALCGSLERQLT